MDDRDAPRRLGGCREDLGIRRPEELPMQPLDGYRHLRLWDGEADASRGFTRSHGDMQGAQARGGALHDERSGSDAVADQGHQDALLFHGDRDG